MTYELAVELKNCGFPQTIKNGFWFPYASDDTREKVYIPTLEELIVELGDKLESIERDRGHIGCWLAMTPDVFGRGKTIKEAVINLYIALNKK